VIRQMELCPREEDSQRIPVESHTKIRISPLEMVTLGATLPRVALEGLEECRLREMDQVTLVRLMSSQHMILLRLTPHKDTIRSSNSMPYPRVLHLGHTVRIIKNTTVHMEASMSMMMTMMSKEALIKGIPNMTQLGRCKRMIIMMGVVC